MSIRRLLLSITAASAAFCAMGVNPGQINFHDEATDTTKINNIISELLPMRDSATPADVARLLVGLPYTAGTLEHTPEMLCINMEEFDCTTFCETVLALTMTLREHRETWRDFAYNLERLRYRNGTLSGYPSRLHYMSDWIIDNSHRGNITDVTSRIGTSRNMTKTIDFMSRNREKYPALAEETNYQAIRERESSFRSHNIPYLSANAVMNATFKEGDMVMFVTKKDGLDVTHVGFVTIIDGTPHLIHASSKSKKVTIEKMPLSEYLRRTPQNAGVRVIRLND